MPVSTAPTRLAPGAEAIWHEFHDALLSFIKRRVRSAEVAEDILQDVMLRIHRQAGGIEHADAIGGWVHAIARNAIADHYRRASTRREVVGAEFDADSIAAEDGDQRDARGDLSACVAPLLKRLSPDSREALALTELEGLTQAEAAARLGLSISGMKSRVQRARSQLKQVFIDCCEIELDARRAVADFEPRRGSCGCRG